MSTSAERQAWLEAAKVECVRLLGAAGCKVPARVRITIGFPSTGGRGKVIGECWSPVASSDDHAEVFVSPRLTDSVTIMGVLTHELIHAAVGTEAKHGPKFRRPAVAVGLVGKMTATTPGPALAGTFKRWVEINGQYPAGGLMVSTRKKQTTRLHKVECPDCGYIARVAAKWLAEVGAPICPADAQPMVAA